MAVILDGPKILFAADSRDLLRRDHAVSASRPIRFELECVHTSRVLSNCLVTLDIHSGKDTFETPGYTLTPQLPSKLNANILGVKIGETSSDGKPWQYQLTRAGRFKLLKS